jgi:hypothetical protein
MRRVVLAATLFVLSAWFVAGSVYRNVRYCAATDPADSWHRARDTLALSDRSPFGSPDHVVRDGRLYLQVQMAWYIAVADFVRLTDWDANGVEEFRRRHPELEGYWPSPERTGAGVRWIGNQFR